MWFESYVESAITRDLRELADLRKVDEVPRLLRLIAAQSANLYKAQTMSNALNIVTKTVQSYTDLLETIFLVKIVQAWTPNIGNREVSTPKIYVVDSGLLSYLLGANEQRAATDDQVTGKLFESFVAMEIARLVAWAETSATQYHYRDRSSDQEIDIVLESRTGALTCVECKASATVHTDDYKAMVRLRNARGEQFVAGAVIYTGQRRNLSPRRSGLVPVSALWDEGGPAVTKLLTPGTGAVKVSTR